MEFQADMLEYQTEQGADQLAAQFGMGQMAADADYNRQLAGSIDSLNLMGSAPYINNMTRTAGFQLAGKGMAPDQISSLLKCLEVLDRDFWIIWWRWKQHSRCA